MKIEQIYLLDAVIYGYQQGEDAARAHALKIERDLRLTIRDQGAKIEALKAERENLARMNDELTTNEWDRIKQVLDAVADKRGWSHEARISVDNAISEIKTPYTAHGVIDPAI